MGCSLRVFVNGVSIGDPQLEQKRVDAFNWLPQLLQYLNPVLGVLFLTVLESLSDEVSALCFGVLVRFIMKLTLNIMNAMAMGLSM